VRRAVATLLLASLVAPASGWAHATLTRAEPAENVERPDDLSNHRVLTWAAGAPSL